MADVPNPQPGTGDGRGRNAERKDARVDALRAATSDPARALAGSAAGGMRAVPARVPDTA